MQVRLCVYVCARMCESAWMGQRYKDRGETKGERWVDGMRAGEGEPQAEGTGVEGQQLPSQGPGTFGPLAMESLTRDGQ